MKKKPKEVKPITNAMYAGAISRYLDIAGKQVNKDNGVPRYIQEFERFEEILYNAAEAKRTT